MPDATDLRRADDAALLSALAAGQPLALAEAYHRSIPAAHAVARRLMGGAGPVEDLLLAVYTELWTAPPTDGPLEGWVRRTTWSLGAEQLRTTGTAPASPSAAGLLPDLPAPDVRFLDAAERAIAELPDDERRALLLAHDRGTPTEAQDEGAAAALVQALIALAGPESSGADAEAMAADACADLPGLGDWSLGLLDAVAGAEVDDAIESRPGCAATSRVARRGRRRIEGLPATPDMGQRILVTVLSQHGGIAGAPAAAPVPPAASEEPAASQEPADGEEPAWAADDVIIAVPAADAADPFAPPAATDAVPVAEVLAEPEDADDPFGPLTEPDAGAPAGDDDHDPFAAYDDAPDPSPVADTADLPQAAAQGQPSAGDPLDEEPEAAAAPPDDVDTGSWMPGPGDATAELRLSDILSDEGEEDDPFAGLDDDDEPAPAPRSRDPYSALRGLDEDPAPTGPQGPISAAFAGPDPTPRSVLLPGEEDDVVDGYVEGQEDDLEVDEAPRSALASVLAWVLPILGGSAIGILVAIQVFGLPA